MSGLIWLFIPHLGLLGKISLLERVPHARLLIGLGVLSILQIALFVKRYDYFKNFTIKIQWALLYAIAIFLVELGIGQQVMNHSPDFITTSRAIAFAIPLPIIIYLLLRKRYELAMGGLLLFSFYMTFRVNPLYQGTGALSQTPISTKIKNISNTDNSTWATEHFLLENFVFMNGAHSLSGVYSYPQLALWHDADPTAQDKVYNRYSHTIFAFDRDSTKTTPTKVSLTGEDSLRISTEPCSDFLQKHHVRYLIASARLNPADRCATLIEEVVYPLQTLYIYRLIF